MADIETSIGISLDTSSALGAIKNLQREISAFHTTLAKGSANAANASASLQKDLINNLNATGQFAASMANVKTTTESFTSALEKNKLSMGEYFRYAGGASKNFSKSFSKEFETINKVARERVKDLQSQYIQLGRGANGQLSAIKVRPLVLDMEDLGTKTQIAAQKQQIFNQLLKQGSTNLLNFGKNTQWAGRQLMVGFTIPLTMFGATAAKTFMDLEKQAIRFKRVYGDLFTTPEDADNMVRSLQELSLEFTKYGVAVESTMSLAADAAAMGKTGTDLLAQVTEANRLAVLGNVEQAQALETTISVTNAFGVATDQLASKIDFLNAVENQTVTSIEDLTIAIPKAGPVVQQLGGNVEDLAYFLTAMKEGGINASEGANALKSGLASLINPTAKASEFLAGFGINIQGIVDANKGDVKGLVTDFAKALDTLDPLNRAQAIEQLFGKFQFSRLSTLFQNVIAEGTQAERVLALTNSTVQDLASLSEKELGKVADSTTYRFQKAVEDLRAAIAPVGEQFLKAITPILEFASEILNKFNALGDGVKNFVVIGGALIAGLGPVLLMTFGLIANGVANVIKGFAAVRGLFLKTKDSSTILGEQIGYMTQEQLDASAVAVSLERAHLNLEQRFTSEAKAITNLVAAYEKAIRAQAAFSGVPGVRGAATTGMKLASGIASVPGPKGAGDVVPAMLSPGEAVIPADKAKKYGSLINAMISGNIPGFAAGKGVPEGSQAKNNPRAIASHFDITAPANLAQTLRDASEYLNEAFIELFRVTKKAAGNGYQVSKEIVTLADAVKEESNSVMFAGGQFYGGTAAVGPSDRNEMFNRLGVAGEPFRMDSLIEAADRAAAELESGSDASIKWKDQLKELAQEGNTAKRILAESADQSQIQIDYMRSNAKKAIEEGLLADKRIRIDGEKVTVASASLQAEKILATVDSQLAESKKTSLSQEQLLEEAQGRYISAMTKASTGQFAIGPAEGYGPKATRDAARNMIRTSGPFAVERPEFAMPYRGGQAAEVAQKKFADLRAQGESAVLAMMKSIAAGAKTALKIASPSKEAESIGKDYGKGLIQGTKSEVSKANAAATQSIANEQAKIYKIPGTRRATSDLEAYTRGMEDFVAKQRVVFDKIIKQHNTLGQSFNNYFAGISSKAGPAFDIGTRQQVPNQKTPGGFEKLNQVAMQTSFAFSSLASVSSMFGAEMGVVNEAMYGMSNALFALTAVTQLLNMALETELFNRIKLNATKYIDVVKDIFSGGLISGFKNIGKVIAPFAKGLSVAGSAVSKFIPIIGTAITAFAVFKFLGDIQEQQKQKIEGMGNAAFAAGEKLQGLAAYAGFTPTRDPGDTYAQSATAAGTQEAAVAAVGITQNEEFQKDIAEGGKYFQDVENLKKATVEEAKAALQALYVELLALAPEGTAPAAIEAVVAAIADAAGKKDIALELPLELNPFKAGNEQKVLDYVKGLQSTIPELEVTTFVAGGGGQTGQTITTDNSAEVEAAGNTFGSAATAGLQQLKTQFDAGQLSVKAYTDSIKGITDSIAALDPIARAAAATKVFENYGVPPELTAGITDLESQLMIIQALSAGVQIDPEIYAALDAADNDKATPQQKAAGVTAEVKLNNLITASLKKQTNAIKDKAEADKDAQATQDLTAIQNEIDALEEVNDKLPTATALLGSEAEAYRFLNDEKWRGLLIDAQNKDADAGGGTANVDALIASYETLNGLKAGNGLDTYIADLEEEDKLKKQLEQAGFDAAESQDILNNSVYRSAALAASASGDWQTFIDKMNKIDELTPDTPAGGSGTPDKTPFQEAIESLKNQQTEIVNTANTYSKLRKAGVDVGKAFKIAKDPVLAAALASEKVGTKKWKELLALINKVNAQLVTSELKNLTNTNIVDAKTTNNVSFLEKAFAKMGYNAAEIDKIMEQIGDNPDLVQKFANDLKDGKVNAESIRNYLASIKNLKIKVSLEDMEADVNQAFSDIAEGISAQRQQIDLDFQFGTNESGKNKIDPLTGLPFNTTEINKKIKEAEDFIAERNYAIDDYEYQLSGIEEKEAEINSAYDKRIEALDKVREINSRIADEQRGQLSLADALSRGDIAAAAAAAQQINEDAATKALDDQTRALEVAREQELGALTATNGMTRVQIETKIRDLKKEIAQKEEDILEPQQRSLGLAEGYRDAANSAVTYLGKNESEWKKIENGVKLAKTQAEGYKKAIEDAIALIPQLNQAYATPTAPAASNNPNQARIDELNRLRKISRENIKNSSDAAYKARLTELNIQRGQEIKSLGGVPLSRGGMVKYLADGGMAIPSFSNLGTDIVPAMLTPGEFVMSKYAVQTHGLDKMKAMNSGSTTTDSVYNYSVNVNVQSGANPDQIARAVMTQIRQVDSQRIRGNRF